MTEVVGLLASIITIIEVSSKVTRLVRGYIESAKDAPQNLRAILVEISTLKVVFKNLRLLVDNQPGTSELLQHLEGEEDTPGPIRNCEEDITKLAALICENAEESSSTGQKRKRHLTYSQFAWPLKEKKISKLLERVSQYKQSINLLLTNENMLVVKRIKQDVEEILLNLSDAETHEILKWLVSVDPSPNHNRACELHEEHTGCWVPRSPEWQDWLCGKSRYMWVHGIPGAGKTVLSSYLVEKVRGSCEKSSDQRQGWAYYYCYHGRNHDETNPCLKWILNQLCRQIKGIPPKLHALYRAGTEPNTYQLLDTLHSMTACFDVIYLVVDALDESLCRENIINVLNTLGSEEAFPMVRLIVTSRDESDIRRFLDNLPTSISMSNKFVDEDIRKYIVATLDRDKKFQRFSCELLREMEEALVKGAQGMFRWVFCQIEILRRLATASAIHKALQELPETLDETYQRILDKIPHHNRDLAIRALSLLCSNSWRSTPGIETLLTAVEYSQKFESGLSEHWLLDGESLQDVCLCLISVCHKPESLPIPERLRYDAVTGDPVVLSHYTVREFLSSTRAIGSHTAPFFIAPDMPGRHMVQAALASLKELAQSTNAVNFRLERFHRVALLILRENQDHILTNTTYMEAFVELLRPKTSTLNQMVSVFQSCLPPSFRRNVVMFSGNRSAIAISFMVLFDLETLARGFLEQQADISAIWNAVTILDGVSCTLLEMCAMNYMAETATFLLERGCTAFDPKTILFRILLPQSLYTSICHDIDRDTTTLFRIFLAANAEHSPVNFRVSPLQLAVLKLLPSSVELLLQAGANPNEAGNPEADLPPGLYYPRDDSVFRRPLQICTTLLEKGFQEKEIQETRALLLHYGAIDISTPKTPNPTDAP